MRSKKSAANQALGKAIRSRREELGYPQEGFAARAGVDRSYYGAIERGEFNVTIDMVERIAAALRTRSSKLFVRANL